MKCPFCPCIFETDEDLRLHLAAWGNYPHEEALRRQHTYLEFGGAE